MEAAPAETLLTHSSGFESGDLSFFFVDFLAFEFAIARTMEYISSLWYNKQHCSY